MLQQTQVARVVPRYLAFLDRWPTVDALAAATPADVIRAVAGARLQPARPQPAPGGPPDRRRGLARRLDRAPGRGPVHGRCGGAVRLRQASPAASIRTFAASSSEPAGSSGPTSAHALMDLGATICLARIPRCSSCPLAEQCPSRGRRYEPLRKQSRFEGSFRQRRARTLTLVAEQPRRRSTLDREATESLAADGLVQVRRGLVSLPDGS